MEHFYSAIKMYGERCAHSAHTINIPICTFSLFSMGASANTNIIIKYTRDARTVALSHSPHTSGEKLKMNEERTRDREGKEKKFRNNIIQGSRSSEHGKSENFPLTQIELSHAARLQMSTNTSSGTILHLSHSSTARTVEQSELEQEKNLSA